MQMSISVGMVLAKSNIAPLKLLRASNRLIRWYFTPPQGSSLVGKLIGLLHTKVILSDERNPSEQLLLSTTLNVFEGEETAAFILLL